jgi:hypothetical protein
VGQRQPPLPQPLKLLFNHLFLISFLRQRVFIYYIFYPHILFKGLYIDFKNTLAFSYINSYLEVESVLGRLKMACFVFGMPIRGERNSSGATIFFGLRPGFWFSGTTIWNCKKYVIPLVCD